MSEDTTRQANVNQQTIATIQQLDARALSELARRGLTSELALLARLLSVDDQEGKRLTGQERTSGRYDGIAIPNIRPGQTRPRAWTVRRYNPDTERRTNGTLRDTRKYMTEPGRSNLFYFVPGTKTEWLSDKSIPILFIEGEFKCLAMWIAAFQGVTNGRPHFLPIGLRGVWGWRGTTGKSWGAEGARRDERGPINDFEQIDWGGRKVLLFFDSNVHTNDSVQAARSQLAIHIRMLGAFAIIVDMPDIDGLNGPDDLLAQQGVEYVLELIEMAFTEHEASQHEDAPISKSVERENFLWSLVGSTGKILAPIRILFELTGFKNDHARLLNGLLEVKPYDRRITLQVVKGWVADKCSVSDSTLSRDIEKLKAEQDEKGITMLEYIPGFISYKTNPPRRVSSKFKRFFLRYALEAIDLAMEIEGRYYTNETLRFACEQVFARIPRQTVKIADGKSSAKLEKRNKQPSVEELESQLLALEEQLIARMVADEWSNEDITARLDELAQSRQARIHQVRQGSQKSECDDYHEEINMGVTFESSSPEALDPPGRHFDDHAALSPVTESHTFTARPMANGDYQRQNSNADCADPDSSISCDGCSAHLALGSSVCANCGARSPPEYRQVDTGERFHASD